MQLENPFTDFSSLVLERWKQAGGASSQPLQESELKRFLGELFSDSETSALDEPTHGGTVATPVLSNWLALRPLVLETLAKRAHLDAAGWIRFNQHFDRLALQFSASPLNCVVPTPSPHADGWRDRYRLATLVTNDVIWDWDFRTGEVVWSAGLERIFGYLPAEAGSRIERSFPWWLEKIHADDRNRVSTSVQQAIEDGETSWSDKYRFLRADGTYAFVIDRCLFQRDPTGALWRVLGSMLDVTDYLEAQRRVEEEAERSASQRAWLEHILELVPAGVTLIERPSGRMIFANRQAHLLAGGQLAMAKDVSEHAPLFTGFTPDGQPVPPEDLPGVRAAEGESFKGVRIIWRTPLKDVVCLTSCAQLPSIAGQPETAVLAFEDVTPMHEAETRLERSVAAREEFLHIASHELRTPVAALLLNLQALVRRISRSSSIERDDILGGLGKAVDQGQRVDALIGTLLQVTQFASGSFELVREAVSLAQLVSDVIERLRQNAAQTGASFVLRAHSDVVGNWDRIRIEQVCTNLLSNALKYAPGTEIEIEVDVRGSDACVVVRDHGIGIPEDQQARIFQRFERASTAKAYSGLGLGLYVVSQIVASHGGRVEVVSRVGEGSTFTVRLPL